MKIRGQKFCSSNHVKDFVEMGKRGGWMREIFVQFETQMLVRRMTEGDFKMEENIEIARKPLLD
jgi:hypothetical protein